MPDDHTLEIELITSATQEDALGLATDLADIGIDAISESRILDDLPVAGMFVRISKGVLAIRDRIFLKKIAHFIVGASKLTDEQRQAFIAKLNLESLEERQKIGEKILLIVDSVNDNYKAEVIGKLFRAYGLGVIDDQEKLFHLCEMVEQCPTASLRGLETATLSQDLTLVFQRILHPDWLVQSETPITAEESNPPQASSALYNTAQPTRYTPAGALLVQILRS